MRPTHARRFDRVIDADLAARRLLLAAVVASLWPLLYARWCWLVVLQAHNARKPQRPPGEPLAGQTVPEAPGGNVDAGSRSTVSEMCRCGHPRTDHIPFGPRACRRCGCGAYQAPPIDASPAMLSPPSVEVACEAKPTPEEQFSLDCRGAVALAERFARGEFEEPSPEMMALAQGAVARREKSLGTPTAQPLAEAARLTLARRLPPKPAARPVVMPGADQVRAKECEHCKGTPGAHLDYLPPAPQHREESPTLYRRLGRRYVPAEPGDIGPLYTRDRQRHYHEVKS